MRKISSMLMLVLVPTWSIFNREVLMDSGVVVTDHLSDIETLDDRFVEEFEAYFVAQMQKQGCPGASVAIVQGNEVKLLSGYGERRHGTDDQIDQESLFRIGSLSKGFAGVLTSILVEEGVLDWNERVRDIVPEFDLKDHSQANRITLRHLLSHSTGLQRHAYTDLTEYGRRVEELLPLFAELNVYGQEGEYYAYQNTIFSLIEVIMHRKTGKTYQQLLQEKIFNPAGMQSASTDYASIANSGNVAYPHVFVKGNRCVPSRLNKKYYNAVSAGGINASISDMSQWLKVVMGQRQDIISNAGLENIFTPFVKNRSNRSFYRWGNVRENHYGMGWRVVQWKDQSLIYHSGSVNNYQAEIALDRKNNIGICVLFSSNNRAVDTVVPDFFKMYQEYIDRVQEGRQLASSAKGKSTDRS